MNRYGNCEYERVSKRTARRLFNEGTKIYASPCKVGLVENILCLGSVTSNYNDFENLSNECIYYNCNWETGYYLAYFKEV